MSRDAESFHAELAARIAQLVREDGLAVGSTLNETRLADALGVSRTPVRAALARLAQQGFVRRKRGVGVELVAMPPAALPQFASPRGDSLVARIAADRRRGTIPEQVSEQDLMRLYGESRTAVKSALAYFASVGVAERNPGYRWRFIEAYDPAVRREIFRIRMLIEPSAMLEPGFSIDREWARDMAERHRAFLDAEWSGAQSVAFFEMNAAFHEGLVQASGNRFFLDSVRRLNRRRRLANYDWRHGGERVAVSCREHLEILQAVLDGDARHGARLLRGHLEGARLARSRGDPHTFGAAGLQ